jgi:hypothetical protein
MRNDEIRGKILRFLYDFNSQSAGELIQIGYLKNELRDIDQNLVQSNLFYLYEKGLIEGKEVEWEKVPISVRISSDGIDAVENQRIASQYQINYQIMQIGTMVGQVAQAGQGATITQTQAMTFDDLRKIVQERQDMSNDEKETVKKILDELETAAQQEILTKKNIDTAKRALAKYGWLIPSLTEVLRYAFGLH